MKIDSFTSEHRFLSNFFQPYIAIAYEGMRYPTAEHAYQAAKTLSIAWKQEIANATTPGKAKRLGRWVEPRADWNEVKVEVMHEIVRIKFNSNPGIGYLLLATGTALLVEGNSWGDTFWGTCEGRGRNELGKILMLVREELRCQEQ